MDTNLLPPPDRRRTVLVRPMLLPGLCRLWRGRHRLQLGSDPARAVVLELPDPAAAQVIDLLDGTRSERTVIAHARRRGVTDADTIAMIDALHDAGLVVPASALLPAQFPDRVRRRLTAEAAALGLRQSDPPVSPAQVLQRRATARIAVTGGGPLATPIAVTLAKAGIGHVAAMLDSEADSRELATAIADQAPGTGIRRLRRPEITFEVRAGDRTPAAVTAAGYARRRLPHLAVTVRDGTAVVGPLVPPRGMPCLNCLDLHRQDRDPEWPTLAAQLAAARTPAVPCAAATVLVAAGLAAGDVLSWVDGFHPATVGASVEVNCAGQLRQRSWPPHPDCHCVHRRGRRG